MKKVLIDLNSNETNYDVIITGCIEFLNNEQNYNIVLVGNTSKAQEVLTKFNYKSSLISFFEVNETLEDSDNPTLVLKEKRNTSLVKSIETLRNDKDAIGLISAGPTGGLLISSIFHLGLTNRLRTPCLSSILYSFSHKKFILADCGANLEIDPETFVKFAEVNSSFASSFITPYPRVALLNVGVESRKGNVNLKKTYEALSNARNINFIGNIEGFDIFNDKADIILTDGVTGNIVLKNSESMARGLNAIYNSRLNNEDIKEVNKYIEDDFYYSSKGGAILLGAKKPIIKLHGKSEASAVTISIKTLIDFYNGYLLNNGK